MTIPHMTLKLRVRWWANNMIVMVICYLPCTISWFWFPTGTYLCTCSRLLYLHVPLGVPYYGHTYSICTCIYWLFQNNNKLFLKFTYCIHFVPCQDQDFQGHVVVFFVFEMRGECSFWWWNWWHHWFINSYMYMYMYIIIYRSLNIPELWDSELFILN